MTRTNRGPPESEPEPVMHRICTDFARTLIPESLTLFAQRGTHTHCDLFTDVEPDTWVSFLHENYPRLMDDVDEAAIAMEYVSDADLIASRWQVRSLLTCKHAM